mmetsp:Transcript_11518/g.24551  ORF Transcript_11518/g.24551 Transcript_11518/m.24551 type:complete len:531 (-) Transcript_11518:122-1714(-)
MGRRRENRSERRPRGDCSHASNPFPRALPLPSPSGKGRRSDGHRSNIRPVDDRSRHKENRQEGSRTNDRNIVSRRSARRTKRSVLNYVIVIAWLAVASFNYLISHSALDGTTGGNDQKQPSKWSRRKMAAFQSKVTPTEENDKAQMFFQTGQLPGKEGMLSRFINRAKAHSIASAVDSQRHKSQQQKELEKSQQQKELKQITQTQKEEDWPPLSSLLDINGHIQEGTDLSGFLDFSIIGFPKTATTSILRHLSDLTDSLPKEHCDLVVNDTVKLLTNIFDDHAQRDKSSSEKRLIGIKCPQDVSAEWSIHNYAKYFPKTKLIVGIRHPVFWFQSLYNFRVSNVPWKKMLPTSKLKRCIPGSQGVCAWRANFHDFLARFGKTPLSSSSELNLLTSGDQLRDQVVKSSVGPVFLYDTSQLSDTIFRQDLRDFLGLKKDIPPFPTIDTSGRFDHITSIKKLTTQEKIDICNPEHDAIRSELMEKARKASIWIRNYFLKSEDVFVSNRIYFEAVLDSWKNDPCGGQDILKGWRR